MRIASWVVPAIVMLTMGAFVGHGFLNRGDYSTAVSKGPVEAAAYTDGRPNLVAAMFYSAWCSSCAVLEPRLQHIVPQFANRPVEFVKFDFSLGQPAELTDKARKLGVERVYEANRGATGFMALIDRRTQTVIKIITLTQSDDTIRRSIEEGLAKASKVAASIRD